jgi:hypothetical protein
MKTNNGKKKVYVRQHIRVVNEEKIKVKTHYRSTPN